LVINNYKKRHSVSYSMDYEVSVEKIWELISKPGNLNSSHPYCKTNEIISWDEENHSDRLVYLNGRNYIRNFQTWEEGKGYTLLIGKENGAQSFVRWEIEEQGNGSKLTITVYPFILAKLPKILAYIPHILWVKPRLGNYLKSVLSGFKYYSETGESVPRNHFGKHPWFS